MIQIKNMFAGIMIYFTLVEHALFGSPYWEATFEPTTLQYTGYVALF